MWKASENSTHRPGERERGLFWELPRRVGRWVGGDEEAGEVSGGRGCPERPDAA